MKHQRAAMCEPSPPIPLQPPMLPSTALSRTCQVLVRVLQVPVLEPPHVGQRSRWRTPQAGCTTDDRVVKR